MPEEHHRSEKHLGVDGRLLIPAATIRLLGWSAGDMVYVTTDAQTLIITDKEQPGKAHRTLRIHRRGSITFAPSILRQANIDGRGTYILDARRSESNEGLLRISAA